MNSLGKKVKAFRMAPERNWSAERMAREVGTSRQNIQNLEARGFGQPRYIADLARVMGTTVDDLLEKDDRVGDAHAVEWPFPGINRAEFDALSRDERLEIQGVVRMRIEALNAARRKKARAPAAEPMSELARELNGLYKAIPADDPDRVKLRGALRFLQEQEKRGVHPTEEQLAFVRSKIRQETLP